MQLPTSVTVGPIFPNGDPLARDEPPSILGEVVLGWLRWDRDRDEELEADVEGDRVWLVSPITPASLVTGVGRRIRRNLGHPFFLETNDDPSNAALLLSSPRSGSTWLAELVTYRQRGRIIFEPFECLRRGQFIPPDDEAPVFSQVFDDVIRGRVRGTWVDQIRATSLPTWRLVKEVKGTNLLRWVVHHRPGLPVIYLLRHPMASCYSEQVLQWNDRLEATLADHALLDGPLAPWAPAMRHHAARANSFERRLLQWCADNLMAIHAPPANGEVLFVFYEDLVMSPATILSEIAAFLGRPFEPRAVERVEKPSRMTRRDSPVRNLQKAHVLEDWRLAIDPGQRRRGVELLADLGVDRIYGDDPMPLGRVRAPHAVAEASGAESPAQVRANRPVKLVEPA